MKPLRLFPALVACLLLFASSALNAQVITVDVNAIPPDVTFCQENVMYELQVENLSMANQEFGIAIDFGNADVANSFAFTIPNGFIETTVGAVVTIHTPLGVGLPPTVGTPLLIEYSVDAYCVDLEDGLVQAISVTNSPEIGAPALVGSYAINSGTLNAPATITSLMPNFPSIDATTTAVNSIDLATGEQGHFSITYTNNGNIDYTGDLELVLSSAFACGAGIVSIDAITVTIGSGSPTPFAGFPVIFPGVTVLEDEDIIVDIAVTLDDCIPGGLDCLAEVVLNWGCNGNLCQQSFQQTLEVTQTTERPWVAVSRISPAPSPSGNSFDYAWDNSCMNTSFGWEYVIINRGDAVAKNVDIDLTSMLGTYTYIDANSIQITINDDRFSTTTLTDFPTPSISTPLLTSGSAHCLSALSHPIDSMYLEIPALQPGENLVIYFETYRCCPNDLAYDQGAYFNHWKLDVDYDHCGSTFNASESLPNGNWYADSYTGVLGTVTQTYEAYNSDNRAGSYIASHVFDGNADLDLIQTYQPDILELTGGQGVCGPAEMFKIRNRTFTGLNANSEYDTQIFTTNGTSGGGATVTGANPAGKFKLEFSWDPGLILDNTPTDPITITNQGITWRPVPGTLIVSTGTNTAEVWFDIQSGFTNDQSGLPVTWTTSFAFRKFFLESDINFYLKACCPLPDNDKIVKAEATVNTLFNPSTGSGCAVCPTDLNCCLIPLSQIVFEVNLHCPGCVAPGIIMDKYTLVRTTLGYADADNDGMPESAPPTGAITSAYDQYEHVNLKGSVVGDELLGVAEGLFVDGDPSVTFAYADWQAYWATHTSNPNPGVAPVAHQFYFEQKITNASLVGLSCTGATLYYIKGSIETPYTLTTFPTSPTADKLLFHVDMDAAFPGMTIDVQAGDKFRFEATYSSCTNPANTVMLSVDNYMYLSVGTLSSGSPFQSGYNQVIDAYRDYFPPLTDPIPNEVFDAVNPFNSTGRNALFYCDAKAGAHHVYRIAREYRELWYNNPGCNKLLEIEVGYKITDDGNDNVFPYEYRYVPRIDTPDLDLGPWLSGSPIGPVKFHINLPQGYMANFLETYTEGLCFENNVQNSIIIARVTDATKMLPNTLLVPGQIIGGMGAVDFSIDPVQVNYTAPYSGAGFYCPTAPYPYPNQNLGNKLVLGDEMFRQGIKFSITPVCSTALSPDAHIATGDAYAIIPDYDSPCDGTNGNDIADNGNTHYLSIPTPSIVVVPQPTTNYGLEYVDYTFTMQVSNGFTASNLYLYFNTADVAFTSHGITVLSITEGSTTHTLSSVASNPNLVHVPLGTLNGAVRTFTVRFALSNCNVAGNTITLPFNYAWSCDGYPDIMDAGITYPPATNLCSAQVPMEVEIAFPNVSLIISQQRGPSPTTCIDYEYRACIRSTNLGGVGNLMATLTLPDEINISMVKVSLGTDLHTVTAVSSVNITGPNTDWTIDISDLTAFSDALPSIVGENGLNNSEGNLCLLVYINIPCAKASYTPVLPVVTIQMTGDRYCGEPIDLITSPTEEGILYTYTGGTVANGCGPFITLTKNCSGNLLFRVTGGPTSAGTYSTAWSHPNPYGLTTFNANTDYNATVTVSSPTVYTVTVTDDATGCMSSKSITLYPVATIDPITASPSTTVCPGTPVVLTTNSNVGVYTWIKRLPAPSVTLYTNTTSNSITVTPTVTTTYRASALFAGSGCTVLSDYTVVVHAVPTPTFVYGNGPILCSYQSTTSIAVTQAANITSYQWSNGAGIISTDPTITVGVGTYTVTVTYTTGCAATATTTITQAAALSLSATVTDASCPGVEDGSIDLMVAGGVPAYSYNWGSEGTTQDISTLGAGSYTVTVTDNIGCIATQIYNISEPAEFFVSLDATDATCHNADDGSITATVTGTSGPFTYHWSTNPSVAGTNTITGLAPGLYSVTVTKGVCTVIESISITEPDAIVITGTVTNVSCYGEDNGSIDITVTGGGGAPGAYTYYWDNGASTEDITGLFAGTYVVDVINDPGCTGTNIFTVTQPDELLVNTVSYNTTACGVADGALEVTISGGTGPYDLDFDGGTLPIFDQIMAGPGTLNIIGVGHGTTNLLITDAHGCEVSTVITVNSNFTSEIEVTTTGCITPGGDNLFAQNLSVNLANGAGGTYTYLWSNGATTAYINNATCGSTYTVTVTDVSGGCTTTASLPLLCLPSTICEEFDVAPLITPAQQTHAFNTFGNGNPGFLSNWRVASGTPQIANSFTIAGVSPFSGNQYALLGLCGGGNNGEGIMLNISGLQPGSYQATMQIRNKTFTGPVRPITIEFALLDNAIPFTYQFLNNCTAIPTLPMAGATSIATYAGFNAQDWVPYTVYFNVPVGGTNDFLWIQPRFTGSVGTQGQDAALLIDHLCISPAATDPLTATADLVDPSCVGDCDGSITVYPAGGVGYGYEYSWVIGNRGYNTPMVPGLCAGTYTVTLVDDNSCGYVQSYSLNDPPQLTVSVTKTDATCTNSNGTATATAAGGTPGYTYAWSHGPTTATVTGLSVGTYIVTAFDSHGCSATDTVDIDSIPMTVNIIATNATCNGSNNGTLTAVPSGGIPLYTYIWSNAMVTQTITVPAGIYSVTVTDATGCIATDTDTIYQPDSLDFNEVITDVSCYGENDGSIYLYTSGGAPVYSYVWSTGSNNSFITGLSAGSYSVTLYDFNGCGKGGYFTVGEPDELDMYINQTNPTACAVADGQIEITLIGGVGPYRYRWSPGGPIAPIPLALGVNSATITGLSAGSYTLTGYDANGCEVGGLSILSTSAGFSLTMSSTGVGCSTPMPNGTATASVGGGPGGPYSWVWSNGGTTSTISGLSTGTYKVTVTNAAGCIATGSVNVTQNVVLASASGNSYSCHYVSGMPLTGTVSASAMGGFGAYTYTWQYPTGIYPTGSTLSGLPPGSYTVTVTDMNGCTGMATATVTNPAPLVATVNTNPATCGNNNGSASVSITGGTAPYSPMWSTGMPAIAIGGLAPGPYSVTVTSLGGCSTSATGVVNAQAGLSLTTYVQNVQCGGSLGSITVMTSGIPPLNYQWEDNIGSTLPFIGAFASGLTTGNYRVTVTDANGCQGEAYVYVGFDDGFDIDYTSVPTSCYGLLDGSATVTPLGGTGPYSYEWVDQYENDLGVVGPTITGVGAGAYGVTVTDANGCSSRMEVYILGTDCCEPYYIETHTIIDQSVVSAYAAGAHIVWPPQVYVRELLSIPPDVEILDITNTDVVFDADGGIQFSGITHLRANNSVFRPCDENLNWVGMLFHENSTGQINSSTFKNAAAATVMIENTSTGVAINNNLYKNCIVSVAVINSISNEPITGNTFMRDDHYHTFVPPPIVLPFPPGENRFIFMMDATVTKLISENDFINTQITPVALSYGIFLDGANANISKNNFANVWRVLDMELVPDYMNFTDNEISYQEGYEEHTSGIHTISMYDINSSAAIYIGTNTFNCQHSVGDFNSPTNNVAIFGTVADNVIILENEFKGYSVPIEFHGSGNATIAFNKIEQFEEQGIYMSGANGLQIFFNEINGIGALTEFPGAGIHIVEPSSQMIVIRNKISMNGIGINPNDPAAVAGVCNGIEYSKTSNSVYMPTVPSAEHFIMDNCIYDTKTAMHFYGVNFNPTATNTLPVFSNNYLYNYTDFGVYIDDYRGNASSPATGDIGTNAAVPHTAGRNSFISNYLSFPVTWGGAMDIFSLTNPIYSFGNSDNLVVNPNVYNVNDDVVFTSNTSCGNMIGNNEYEMPDDVTMFRIMDESVWVDENRYEAEELDVIKSSNTQHPVTKVGNTYQLASNYLEVVEQVITRRMEFSIKTLSLLRGNNNDMDVFHAGINGSGLLAADELLHFNYTYLQIKKDDVGMATLINGATSSDPDMLEWIQLKKIGLNLKGFNMLFEAPPVTDIATLRAISQRNGKYANMAQGKLNALLGGHDHIFAMPEPPHAPKRAEGDELATQGNMAMVYPNPFSGSFQLVYQIGEDMVNAKAYVTDILGQTLMTIPLINQNGVIEFDLSHHANGIYFLTVMNGDERFTVQKVVKGL